MPSRLRTVSPLSRVLGLAAALAAALLIGTYFTPGAGSAQQPTKGIPSELLIGGITADEYAAQQASLHGWLMKETPAGVLAAPLTVTLTREERTDLQKHQDSGESPAVVGRTKPLSVPVRFSSLDSALLSANPRRAGNGWLQATPDGGFAWALAVASPQAGAIRVHVTGLDLPPDADLFFFSPEGQAFGPYTGRGPGGDGEFWTDTVFGSQGVVLLRHYGPGGAADLKGISFTLSEIGHIGPKFAKAAGAVPEIFCSFNASCIENASCYTNTPADPAKGAVALMQWISGLYIYTCTGGLLADTVSGSQIPYFLTANHCISQSKNAKSLQTYFQFSIPCNSSNCPSQTHPGGIQLLGATIKATGTAGDFTLMQLNGTPPAGSVFLGWNNTPIESDPPTTKLYRISHPAWAPQAYSDQHVDRDAPTCTSWPRGQRIYSRTDNGGTEGGSSGSPVVNSASQVVGQLSGACGTNVTDSCDNVNNATVDGAFAYYWPSVQPYLDPSGGCVPVTEICNDGKDNDCDNLIDCADPDCATSPYCSCSPSGTSCTSNSQCCSGVCKGGGTRKTCR